MVHISDYDWKKMSDTEKAERKQLQLDTKTALWDQLGERERRTLWEAEERKGKVRKKNLERFKRYKAEKAEKTDKAGEVEEGREEQEEAATTTLTREGESRTKVVEGDNEAVEAEVVAEEEYGAGVPMEARRGRRRRG